MAVFSDLTPREQKTLRLRAGGLTYDKIAKIIGLNSKERVRQILVIARRRLRHGLPDGDDRTYARWTTEMNERETYIAYGEKHTTSAEEFYGHPRRRAEREYREQRRKLEFEERNRVEEENRRLSDIEAIEAQMFRDGFDIPADVTVCKGRDGNWRVWDPGPDYPEARRIVSERLAGRKAQT